MRLRKPCDLHPVEFRSERPVQTVSETAQAIARVCRDMTTHLAQLLIAWDEDEQRHAGQTDRPLDRPTEVELASTAGAVRTAALGCLFSDPSAL